MHALEHSFHQFRQCMRGGSCGEPAIHYLLETRHAELTAAFRFGLGDAIGVKQQQIVRQQIECFDEALGVGIKPQRNVDCAQFLPVYPQGLANSRWIVARAGEFETLFFPIEHADKKVTKTLPCIYS